MSERDEITDTGAAAGAPGEHRVRGGGCRTGHRARFAAAAVLLLGLGAVGGAVLATATGVAAHEGWGGGWATGEHRHHHGLADISPERARERLHDVAAFALGRVDATSEQRAKVDAIIDRFVAKVAPLRQKQRANRRDLVAALARPQIDRDALEHVRREELGLADAFSGALVGAVGDIAQVLDASQRQALLEHLARHDR